MPKEPQTFDDERAQEAGLSPGGDNNGNINPESKQSNENERVGPVDGFKDKRAGIEKDIKNATGAVEGNPLAIARLLKDPKKVILGVVGSCLINPVSWSVFFIIFLIVIIAGSSASVSVGETDGLCKKIASVILPQEINDKNNDTSYKEALINAEKVTDTSRFLIEAVDYQENKLGTDDPNRDTYAALTDIGNKIQEANYARSGTENNWKIKRDSSGQPIKGLPEITGKVTDNFAVTIALQNY